MPQSLAGDPGVKGALGRYAAKGLVDLLQGDVLIQVPPHQSLIEVGSTSDGGDASRTVEGQVLDLGWEKLRESGRVRTAEGAH